ncbi:autophagy protein Atg13 [Stachybotrys elegans]|uniref:Autophagy-related protein 13 n=1 Tax=Stachybotrys elegans TaxID=80388 RepID=A0A8K0STK4_9HYPO|nr:autophagy protein Atg13 [Stachybotrys elegans]
MHQHPRVPPRVASPAPAAQTNHARSNSQREAAFTSRQRAGSIASARDGLGSPATEFPPPIGIPAESIKKLDQIIQNFYIKAATLILDSRIKVRPVRTANGSRKLNKWYQIETDEIEDFRDELKMWKNCGSFDNRPPPLVIEVYLDTADLKDSQSLVILDEDGKRWDVLDQLNSSASSDGGSSAGSSSKNTQVLLERWKVELKPRANLPADDFGPILPTVYKKAIVFFRSLFITTRLIPAWRFASQRLAKTSHPSLIPRCRVLFAETKRDGPDLLRQSIDGRRDPVTEYMFGDLEVPVGRMSTSVTYRNDCNFRVDDSEALLSSRFMGVDENFFKPSLPQRSDRQREHSVGVGSLRDRRPKQGLEDLHQTYGSLSTFHGDGPMGTSPISALKAVRPPGSDTSSPPSSLPAQPEIDPPHSLPISVRALANRPQLRTGDGTGRRPSISFQPFKAGSLSGSPIPRSNDTDAPASPHSLTRPSGIPSLSQPRNRTSLTAGMPASLRGGPPAANNEPPTPSSPRPTSTSRYSSSFTHRRGRHSFGGASAVSKPDDEQGSSGRQSLSSSVAQPGSGLLAEAEGVSSGSVGVDEGENTIEDFLKAIDSKRTLKSFDAPKRGESATNRTVAQLSRFHNMKESNNALTDSMTSSVQMHRSSSSSSRQLTSVPGMVAPASLSASSSPGKPLSPHTPHTPAIPSRLSENSSIDYSAAQSTRVAARHGRIPQGVSAPGPNRESTITQEGTTAIDIPLSPRLGSYQQRRSSSVAQQSRPLGEDDETGMSFAPHRSISLGADDDREPPTMSILLGRQLEREEDARVRERSNDSRRPASVMSGPEVPQTRHRGSSDANPPEGLISPGQQSSPFGRKRYMGMAAAGRRNTPPQTSSRGSFAGSMTRPVRGDDESVNEEPLVFDLSEMDPQSRRSLEEGRGGAHTNSAERLGAGTNSSIRRDW